MDIAASIGIALFPEHGERQRRGCCAHADVAMYGAKRNRLGHAFYDASEEPPPGRLTLLGELRRAVEADELTLPTSRRSSSRAAGVRGRGAGALAPPAARRGVAGRLHALRRADRRHPRAHALGARRPRPSRRGRGTARA